MEKCCAYKKAAMGLFYTKATMNTLYIFTVLVCAVGAAEWDKFVTPEKEAKMRAVSELASQGVDLYKAYDSYTGSQEKVLEVVYPFTDDEREKIGKFAEGDYWSVVVERGNPVVMFGKFQALARKNGEEEEYRKVYPVIFNALRRAAVTQMSLNDEESAFLATVRQGLKFIAENPELYDKLVAMAFEE